MLTWIGAVAVLGMLALARTIAAFRDTPVELTGTDPAEADRWLLALDRARRELGYVPEFTGQQAIKRLAASALILSGAFAGLAGANDVLGIQGLFKANWDPGYGFTAFALVYLARLNSLLLIPFAFFFSFLLVGGEATRFLAQPVGTSAPSWVAD